MMTWTGFTSVDYSKLAMQKTACDKDTSEKTWLSAAPGYSQRQAQVQWPV